MNLILKLLRLLFQPKKPVPQEPTKPVEAPEKTPLFKGGSSGGGGASAVIAPESVKPAVIAPQPAPQPQKPLTIVDETVTFREALRLILRFESGYVFDKADSGGETNLGITHKVYDEYRISKGLPVRSVKDITEDECTDIYRTRYWLLGKCNRLPTCLAMAHFDTCVNAGIGQAAKIMQRTVEVKDDGIIGEGTFKAVAAVFIKAGDKKMAMNYLERRRDF